MLDITTNNLSASNISYCGYDIAADAAELLDDDMMDPLFDEDWLHENNLDILFDLFEEEIENKGGADPNNGSSTLFGTSPVTSYLLGTSPSLASALDLLYFDNQQPTINNNSNFAAQQQQFTSAATISATGANIGNTNTSIASNSSASCSFNLSSSKSSNKLNGSKKSAHSSNGRATAQQVGASNTGSMSGSVTNAMRIKRGLKRGQSEGVSLLAKPSSSNSGTKVVGGSSGSSKRDRKSDKTNSTSKNNSDKTSAKITDFKSSIIIGNTSNASNRNGIDVNYSKQNQQQQKRERYYLHNCQQHVHYITGRAIISEHAYAVVGH